MISKHINKDQAQLFDFSELKLCFRSIRIINKVPQSIKFISKLYLNGNHLMSLSGIDQFANLEIFHFDYNLISLPEQLLKISNPFFLRNISFIANPIFHCRELNLQNLRKKGFTRLEMMNQPQNHSFSPFRNTINEVGKQFKQKDEAKNSLTARRKPTYAFVPSPDKTKRKNVGKIYYTRYVPPHISNYNQDENGQKQDITKNLSETTGILKSNQPSVSVFKHNHNQIRPFEQINMGDPNQAINLSIKTEKESLSEQFLIQQKQRLADIYYERVNIQKYFQRLKNKRVKQIQQQIEPYKGEILNNKLETIHFSLIKLKHKLVHSRT